MQINSGLILRPESNVILGGVTGRRYSAVPSLSRVTAGGLKHSRPNEVCCHVNQCIPFVPKGREISCGKSITTKPCAPCGKGSQSRIPMGIAVFRA